MFDGERYEIGLLWNDNERTSPNNLASATGHLKSLERRFNNQPQLKRRYEETIQKDLNKGFIKELDYHEIKKTSDCPNGIFQITLLPVVNPHKLEKVKGVCNAAAKYKGLSLNDKLMSGPNLLSNLLELVFRFREKENAITADIESMF